MYQLAKQRHCLLRFRFSSVLVWQVVVGMMMTMWLSFNGIAVLQGAVAAASALETTQATIHKQLLVTIPFTRPGSSFSRRTQASSTSLATATSSKTFASKRRSDDVIFKVAYSHAAAVLLALDHFHARNSTVVPELQTDASFSTDRCNVMWHVTLADSLSSGKGSVEALHQTTPQQQLESNESSSVCSSSSPPFHAVVGGYQYGEQPGLQLTTAANSFNIPSVMYGGSNLRAVNQNEFPLSSRVYPDGLALGVPLIDYIHTHLNRTNYYGFIFPSFSETAEQILDVLVDVAVKDYHIFSHVQPYQPNSYIPGPSATIALERMLETGFRTLIIILDDWATELDIMAQAFQELGLSCSDFVIVLVGNLDLSLFQDHSEGQGQNDQDQQALIPTAVKEFVKGSVYVQPLETFGWFADDAFLMAWHNQTEDLAHRVDELVRSAVGMSEDELSAVLAMDDNYFQTHEPDLGAGFCYDAVMSVLLGSCRSNVAGIRDTMFGTNLFETHAIQGISFTGASGYVQFSKSQIYPGSRASYTVPFGAYNMFVPTNSSSPNEDMMSTSLPLVTTMTAVRMGSRNDSSAFPWKIKMPVVFPNGKTEPPPLRQTTNGNYLKNSVQIIGFVLFSINVTFIVFCAVWVMYYVNSRIVRASQPVFLFLLLFGSALLATAIVATAFDESYGKSNAELCTLCTITPWLIVCGFQVIYSSLWMKLWRINKVLQFRRKAVTVSSVVGPAAVLFVGVLILLTVWTAMKKFTWVRIEIDPMTGESEGRCHVENAVAFYTPLLILMLIPVILTLAMSWKTKDVSKEYSESRWLIALVFFHIQLLLISIPLLLLVQGTFSSVRFMVQSSVLFLFSISSVGFILIPKLWRFYFPENKNRSARGSHSHGNVAVSGLNQSCTNNLSSNNTEEGQQNTLNNT